MKDGGFREGAHNVMSKNPGWLGLRDLVPFSFFELVMVV